MLGLPQLADMFSAPFITWFSDGSIIAIGIMAVLLIILTILLMDITSSAHAGGKKIKQAARRQAEAVISRARDEASRITQHAAKQSAEIITHANDAIAGARGEISEAIRATIAYQTAEVTHESQDLLKGYKEMTGGMKKEYADTLQKASKAIIDEAHDVISEFQKFFKEKTEHYESVVDEHIREWHVDAKREINDYKRDATQKIDESIFRVLQMVTKDVLGRTLNAEEHRELIVRALEEAKKEGFFEL